MLVVALSIARRHARDEPHALCRRVIVLSQPIGLKSQPSHRVVWTAGFLTIRVTRDKVGGRALAEVGESIHVLEEVRLEARRSVIRRGRRGRASLSLKASRPHRIRLGGEFGAREVGGGDVDREP